MLLSKHILQARSILASLPYYLLLVLLSGNENHLCMSPELDILGSFLVFVKVFITV
jgi:hypothetical protein